jgi:methylmalonyl-CoA mutase
VVAGARRLARIDRGEEVMVGVNKYQAEDEDDFDILEVDNARVRETQVARLEALRERRDGTACQAALDALTAAAAGEGRGNLLALTIEAVRARATVGEVSQALETVFTRYRVQGRTVSGIYGAAFAGDRDFENICAQVAAFAADEGRRPRLLVIKMGQDGHDRGARVVATAFADIGFDVDVGPLFQTPDEAARQAVENDVHAIGVSTQAGGHMTLVPALIQALDALDAGDIAVICGGVVPARDHDALNAAGVAAIFGPGTHIPSAAARVLDIIRRRGAGRGRPE